MVVKDGIGVYANTDIALEISIVEILLITIISFLGASIHEILTYAINKAKPDLKRSSMNIAITILITSIISASINPFIMCISPRLILLPPLIMGLLGIEFASRLIHLQSSFKLLEYILGFFRITRARNTTIEDRKEEEYIKETKRLNDIDTKNIISSLLNSILYQMKNIENDYDTMDKMFFLSKYNEVKKNSLLIQSYIKQVDTLPADIVLLVAEMVREEAQLDELYDKIHTDDHN